MDMNNVFNGVNWQEVQPAAAGRETFSEGWSQVVIADSVGKENNQKSGFGLTLYLKGVSGENNGKIIDDFINVFHSTPKAQEIGQRQFSAYCHATGEFKPVDNHASNLREKPFWVKTILEEDSFTNDKGEVVKTTRSRVKDWDTNNGTKHGATASGNASAPAPATPPATNAAPSNPPAEEKPVQAAWGSPPPSTGASTTEAAPTKTAPWNS